MNIESIINSGKVPRHLLPWPGFPLNAKIIDGHAFLFDVCAGLHLVDDEGFGGYTVMEDSDIELSRHLHAVRHAHGRVLKTGLGMGCFVRMCLQKPSVKHIDVVEISKEVIDHFGTEFTRNDRVTIHHMDAFEFSLTNGPWDFAWHDIYCEGNQGLQGKHVELIKRYHKHVKIQGAWNLPRWVRRLVPEII